MNIVKCTKTEQHYASKKINFIEDFSCNVRRCLPENSLVHTKTGLKKIEDICIGDKVLTVSGFEEVLNVFNQGKQNVVKIKTQDGEFKCTPNHKMAVLTGCSVYEWKQAKNLKHDDILMTSRRFIDGIITRLPRSEDVIVPTLDEYTAWFTGILQSTDAYENIKVKSYFSYKFDKQYYNIASRFKDILYKFVDNASDTVIKFHEYSTFYVVSCSSIEIYEYFDKNMTMWTSRKIIPEYILTGTCDIRMSYIVGIIDGNTNCSTLRKGRVPLNIYSSVDKQFIQNIQTLCYSCGFETRFQYSGKNDLYELNAITNYAIESILEASVICKYNVVNSYIDMPIHNVNGFPIKFINQKRKFATINAKLGLQNAKNISMNIYDEFFDNLCYCPVKVNSISTETEFVETYDIEIKNNHQFYCCGYLTHNSGD